MESTLYALGKAIERTVLGADHPEIKAARDAAMNSNPTPGDVEVSSNAMPGAWQFVTALPYGAKVVCMTQFNGRVYVATEQCVYWLDGDVLRRVELVAP